MTAYGRKVRELQRRIRACEEKKRNVIDCCNDLSRQCEHNRISYSRYRILLKDQLGGKSISDTLVHYDRAITRYRVAVSQYKSDTPDRLNIALVVMLILSAGLWIPVLNNLRASPTGFVAGETTESYTDAINMNLSGSYSWIPPESGELRSVMVSGRITGNGTVGIYLVSRNSRQLIYRTPEREGIAAITGNVVDNQTEDNRTGNSSGADPANESEITPEITLNLKYKEGTPFDADNDGAETLEGVIDFYADSAFSWDANLSNVCSVWRISSGGTESTICHGAWRCCNFAELLPEEGHSWDEMHLYYGLLGAGTENNVSSRVLYVDYSLDPENPYSVIAYSNWSTLPARFYEPADEWLDIEDECLETCLLGLDEYNYTIAVETENATVFLSNITYSVVEKNKKPQLVRAIPQVTAGANFTINASDYFTDDDTLVYAVEGCDIPHTITGGIIRFKPDATGISKCRIRASDDQDSVLSNVFKVTVVRVVPLVVDQAINITLATQETVRVIVRLIDNTSGSNLSLIRKIDEFEVLYLNSSALNELQNNLYALEVMIDQPLSLLLNDSIGIIGAESAWNISLNGSGQRVCVIDSGVDNGVVPVAGGYDFVNNDADPYDDHGHGTSVAYVIHRIAPESGIIAVKVIDENGAGYESDVLAGIEYCREQNVSVISFSIGSGGYPGTCNDNIVASYANSAAAAGIFVSAATGNDGTALLKSPACASLVTAVAASTKNDTLANFSNVNALVRIVAPGDSITTILPGGDAIVRSGTSMSAPHVAGAAALLLQNDDLEPEELEEKIAISGKVIEHDGRNYSRIDIGRALNITVNVTVNETNITFAANATVDPRVEEFVNRVGFVRAIVRVSDPNISLNYSIIVRVNQYIALILDNESLSVLRHLPGVEEIVMDQPVLLLLNESVPLIRADMNLSVNGSGQRICVIDTGVDYSVVPNYEYGFDFVNNDTDPFDEHGHGTSVANVIYNVAPGAGIVAARVVNGSGTGYESDVLLGIQYCREQNVSVISLSIGSGAYDTCYCDDNPVANQSNEAVLDGIFVVAATGNSYSTRAKSPSCASRVASVSSTDKRDNVSLFADINNITKLLAPGEQIYTKTVGGNNTTVSGTSMSAAHVAGAAALILQNSSLSPTELSYRLRSTGRVVEFILQNYSRIDLLNAILNNVTNTPKEMDAVQCSESLYSPLALLTGPAVTIQCSSYGCLRIQNSGGTDIAVITEYGHMSTIGALTQGCTSSPNGNDWQIQDSSSNVKAWLDDSTGAFCIDGSLSTETTVSPSGSNDFIVRNPSNANVAMLDGGTGNLVLLGNYSQNAGPITIT
ncbi:MAG: S8 family serine peptidase [archaeon]